MNNIDRIERKIRGLLAKAKDQDGTPEGDAFRRKAFDLMARYGVDEAALGSPEGAEVVRVEVRLPGAYTGSQASLLVHLAAALHCATAQVGGGVRVQSVELFGRKRHTDRVMMLWSILNPQMLAAANKAARRAGSSSSPVFKRSFMRGYIYAVYVALEEAEKGATADAGRSHEVAVISDQDKAQEAMRAMYGGRLRSSRDGGRNDWNAVHSGSQEGSRADIGRTRVGGRAAIGM